MSEQLPNPEVFIGPQGTKLEICEGEAHKDSEIGIVTDYGYGFGLPLEDFEAFVKFWNSRAGNSHEELLTLAKAVIEYKQRRGYIGAGFEDLVWLASEAINKAEGSGA